MYRESPPVAKAHGSGGSLPGTQPVACADHTHEASAATGDRSHFSSQQGLALTIKS